MVKKIKKIKKVSVFVLLKNKILSIVTMLILLAPTILEVIDEHSELIKQQIGAGYYLTVLVLFSCFNFYNLSNQQKKNLECDHDHKANDEVSSEENSGNEEETNEANQDVKSENVSDHN